jgi:hypothetical protein
MTKIHKLVPIKDNVKIKENGKRIVIDIMIPLDRDDFNFLKEMYDMDIDVSGNIINGEGMIVQTFSNAVRSLDINNRALENNSND